jgi:hypothetical protein
LPATAHSVPECGGPPPLSRINLPALSGARVHNNHRMNHSPVSWGEKAATWLAKIAASEQKTTQCENEGLIDPFYQKMNQTMG